ncbi:MAG: hypothetical protein IJB34_05840 [Clostridia bacterium]|nr:hypothetical protein [Clostridia bacterium]
MSLQAILNYQEIDRKLFKLERDFAGSEARKEYVKIKKYLESAPEKLEALESKATALKAEAESLSAKYAQLESTLSEFDNVEEMIKDGADVGFYKKEALKLVDKLKKLKAEINTLSTSIKEVDAEYQKLKKQIKAAEAQAPEVIKNYKAAKAAVDKEREPLEAELAKAGEAVEPSLLAKYKTKRKEKIFPIVGELYAGRCPFCSMEPPIAAKALLANGWECDGPNCHRIIFEKK